MRNIAFVISTYNKRDSTLGRNCYHKRLKAPRCAVSTLGGNCYQQKLISAGAGAGGRVFVGDKLQAQKSRDVPGLIG